VQNTFEIVAPCNDVVPPIVTAPIALNTTASKNEAPATSFAAEPDPDVAPTGLVMRSIIIAIANPEKRERIAQHWRDKEYMVSSVATGLLVLDEMAGALLGESYVDANPLLIVLDDILPGVLGRSIVDGIRDLGWTTPIVLLGGEARDDDAWTIVLPKECPERLLHEVAQTLAENSTANSRERLPPATRVIPLATTLGILGFRWSAADDKFELRPPVDSHSCLWSGTLATWTTNVHPKDRALLARRFLKFSNGQIKRLLVEVRWRAHFGRYRWIEVRGHRQPDHSIVGALVDIDRLKRRELSFARDAKRDGMTNLCNRKEFERRLTRLTKQTRNFGMLFLDLNGFKPINDALGHLAGDELLRQVGERLRQSVRQHDLVGRLGGDEFGVLLMEPLPLNRLSEVECRIHRSIRNPFTIAKHTFVISASIGSVDARVSAGSAAELWEAADVAMYQQKRNRHVLPMQA